MARIFFFIHAFHVYQSGILFMLLLYLHPDINVDLILGCPKLYSLNSSDLNVLQDEDLSPVTTNTWKRVSHVKMT